MRSFEYTALAGHVIFGPHAAAERLVVVAEPERALADELTAPLALEATA